MPQITNEMIWEAVKKTDTAVQSLIKTIRGAPDSHEDMGLIGDVYNNTQFRKDAAKFKWIFIVAVFALCGTVVAQMIIG